jgi:aminoglycoside phosphotransferase (APT) family kinase protein
VATSDFHTFEADDRLIFRLPRDSEGATWLSRERVLLNRIGLSLPLNVPDIRYVGKPSAQWPFVFTGYPKLHGCSGETHRPNPSHWAALARQLGEFLSATHQTPTGIARSVGLPSRLPPSPTKCARDLETYAPILRSRGARYLTAAMEPYLCGGMPAQPKTRSRPTLTHSDLKGEHILLNEDGSSITAIIDWADASITDQSSTSWD